MEFQRNEFVGKSFKAVNFCKIWNEEGKRRQSESENISVQWMLGQSFLLHLKNTVVPIITLCGRLRQEDYHESEGSLS